MEAIKKKIEIVLLLLAIVSCVLVSFSNSNFSLGVVGVFGAIAGFIITDRLKIFSLDGWLANFASLAVLYLVFRDFSEGDQTQKLEAVAQLLVYLQTILMFQPKSPRLVWQILTLSILQVSIAAIFSLDFDAGVLFPLYFVVAGVAMVLQTIYCHRNRVIRANNRLGDQGSVDPEGTELVPQASRQPIVVQESMPLEVTVFDKRFFQFGLWLIVSAAFATLAFCVLPRHVSPWYGPAVHEVATAGMMTAVDLEQRGKVRLSKDIVFRASFEEAGTRKPLKDMGTPYFRAVAFSKIAIKNGHTSFTAPYDRVYDEVYQSLPRYKGRGRQIRQIITLEKTTDPLVYGVMPVFRIPRETPDELEFCHEISAYTRCREKQEISVAPYKYETGTLLDHRGRFLMSWPFVSNTKDYTQQPLSRDPEYQSWLVKMDRDRYPGVVTTADRIAAESKGSSRLALAQKMTSFFQQKGRFFYTLDFTKVTMDKRIDPIEDFFSNHRKGHCELYAAALTLMLRSQGIPARLIVGFHGSEYNTLTESYFVRGTDAHAWVEVYLRPEDCTPQMNFEGSAGPGGAWKILDPTPVGIEAPEVSGRGSAIEMARSYWQDYVLGMEGTDVADSSTSVPDSLIKFMSNFDVIEMDRNLTQWKRMAGDPWVRWMAVFAIAGLVLLRFVLKSAWQAIGKRVRASNQKKGLVMLFADAISAIAPALGEWVRNVSAGSQSTQFYRQLTQLLSEQGLQKKERQTQRSFAFEVADAVSEHRQGQNIGRIVIALTEHYNAIRFGDQQLDEETRARIHGQLDAVQTALREAPLLSEQKQEQRS
jgi:hypothetical protein